MFIGKFVNKIFGINKSKKKKSKYDGYILEQNHITYVKSDDFEILTYEEFHLDLLLDDYFNTLSARTVRNKK